MPKFRDADRAAIQDTLVREGKKLFRRYGLKKTSVEELARAAGIAKGTFYHFFESKEDLCLAVFDREETNMTAALDKLLARHPDPARAFRAVVEFSLEFIRRDSLLARLRETGEIDVLARGVSRERLAAHLAHDSITAEQVLAALRAKGARVAIKPDVFAGVLRAVVVLALQDRMIGEDVFQPVIALVGDWITDGLLKGKVKR